MQAGATTVEIAGDTVIVQLRGVVDTDVMALILDCSTQVESVHGYYLALIDVRELSTIVPEARRMAAAFAEKHRVMGNACFGGTPVVRSLLGLMARGVAMFSWGRAIPVGFFSTEAEARVWLDKHRLLAQRAQKAQKVQKAQDG